MRYRLEYAPVWLLANLIRWLPRPLARGLCISVGLLIYVLHGRLRKVGMRNLDLAFPAKSRQEKKEILRMLFIGLGRQLAEFCLFPRYTPRTLREWWCMKALRILPTLMLAVRAWFFLRHTLGDGK